MSRVFTLAILVTLVITQPAWSQYTLVDAFPGLHVTDPVDFQQGPDGRYYVVELDGRIVSFEHPDEVLEVLDIRHLVDRTFDGGLYSIDFHPDFESNGLIYINYTADDPIRKVVVGYTIGESSQADPESAMINLEIPLLTGGHNGGTLAFGPDGYLYVVTGDGNCCTLDEMGMGQDTETLTGAIARIDVDNPSENAGYGIPADNPFVGIPGYREEIYAYGFRNPWRFSFDAETGELWVGDVGESTKEEVSLVESGRNYGWNILEGTNCLGSTEECTRDDLTPPIFEYGRDDGRSITGGFVYRGSDAPDLVGRYVFSDWVTGRIWALDPETRDTTLLMDTEHRVVSFGEDLENELYVVSIAGVIYQIVPAKTSSRDEVAGYDVEFGFYPNPAHDRVAMEYTLPSSAHVTLEIYDVLGERVRTILSTIQMVGPQQTTWDGRDESGRMVASGVYFYRLSVDDRIGAAGPIAFVR